MKSATWNVLAVSAMFALAGWLGVSNAAEPDKDKPAAKAEAAKTTQDVVIFRNGNVLYGKVVSETPTSIHFKGLIAGIEAEMDYPKADVLEIKRGVDAKAADAPATDAKPGVKADVKTAKTPPADDGIAKKRYYWLDLHGKFGEDISQTPIRKAMQDARASKADVIIIDLDAALLDMRDGSEKPEFEGDFDKMMRAEKILPIFVNEMPVDWGGADKMPRLVFWIKKAMGGACFLPLISHEIYFHPEGKMGGVGNLSYVLTGNERVVKKQISLRLQHAVGWALVGGYSEELVRAMTMREYVLSVRYVNGEPQLFEGYPSNPGEELLTDDGEGANQDTIEQLARDEGNDVLTLTADVAKKLRVSKGTADTKDELLGLLGLDRSGVEIKGKSEQIMKDWAKGVDNAQVQVGKLLDEIREIRVEGDWEARKRARGAMITKWDDIKGIITRWGEGMNIFWLYRHGIPMTEESEPDLTRITAIQEAIRIEQMKDKKK
jgi:hypothetical protein